MCLAVPPVILGFRLGTHLSVFLKAENLNAQYGDTLMTRKKNTPDNNLSESLGLPVLREGCLGGKTRGSLVCLFDTDDQRVACCV